MLSFLYNNFRKKDNITLADRQNSFCMHIFDVIAELMIGSKIFAMFGFHTYALLYIIIHLYSRRKMIDTIKQEKKKYTLRNLTQYVT